MRRIVCIGLNKQDEAFIAECLDGNKVRLICHAHISQAREYIEENKDSTIMILVSEAVLCEDEFRLISWLKEFLGFRQMPVICIGEACDDVQNANMRESEMLEHGVTSYLVPPFSRRVLFCRINTVLQQRVIFDEMLQQIRAITEIMNTGITTAYDDGEKINFIYANERFFEIIGYAREEFLSEHAADVFELIAPEHRDAVKGALKYSEETRKRTQLIFEVIRQDGQRVWIKANNNTYFVESKALLAHVTSYEDITNQKRAEERIKTINRRLSNFEIFFQLDITNRVLEQYHTVYEPENDITCSELCSIPYEELMLSKVYKSDQRTTLEALSYDSLMKHYNAGELKYSVEYRRLFTNGDIRWFAATVILIDGVSEGLVNAMVYSHDVNEKITARMAKDRVVDTDVDDITLVDVSTGEARVLQVRFDSLVKVGRSKYDENIRMYIDDEVAEEDRERCRCFFNLSNLIKQVNLSESAELSYMVIRHGMSNRRKNCTVNYLDSTREALLIVGRDITAIYERELEQKMALQHAADLANLASKAKSDFLSRMSHDMRNPLNAIIGVTELAKNNYDADKAKEYFDKIEVAGKHLLGLINNTLDLSKIESGTMELHRESYSLEEFRLGIDTVIKPMMDKKNIEFYVNLKDDITNIMVDKLRFNQIFFNLLSNAAKYTARGGRVEFISEEIPARNDKFGMRFYIRDNGIGMSKEYQRVLFEPFTQEYGRAHTEQRGTGLGLAIVKQIVDLAEGSIKVKSEIGKGTEFIVELYAYNVNELIPVGNNNRLVDMSLLRNAHVLLADDNEMNALIIKEILVYYGCQVDMVGNGMEALEAFVASDVGYYDVILTDVMMPEMDGLEEARCIRALDRSDARCIPIVAATADAYSDIYEKIITAGMNERVVKPIDPMLLCEIMVKLIHDRPDRHL